MDLRVYFCNLPRLAHHTDGFDVTFLTSNLFLSLTAGVRSTSILSAILESRKREWSPYASTALGKTNVEWVDVCT